MRIRTAVVLPAPFGPSSPSTVPVGTEKLDAVERDDGTEPLLEIFDDDGVRHGDHTFAQLLE